MISLADLDFALHDTLHFTHGLHAFAAKCPPPLAAWGITTYSEPGDTVLDPMAGSGTTLVEGRLAGRAVQGADIDPLACLLSKVKATPLPLSLLASASAHLLEQVESAAATWDHLWRRSGSVDAALHESGLRLPSFPRREYWFEPTVSAKLAVLKRAIVTADCPEDVRDFFFAAFSSLIVARTSVANARDIVHSRHHHVRHDTPPDVVSLFAKRLQRMQRQMAAFVESLPATAADQATEVFRADARQLPLPSGSVDLVFTSPPYCNALDYPRAHQFVIAWLGDVLGVDSANYMRMARTYIGSDRAPKALPLDLVQSSVNSPIAQRVIHDVAAVDRVRAAIVQRYFEDMTTALAEIGRVLKPERHAVLVICPSNIRQVSIPSHEVFMEIGERLTLDDGSCLRTVANHQRSIDDRKRLLPYMDTTALAQRMRTEYVLALRKQRQ